MIDANLHDKCEKSLKKLENGIPGKGLRVETHSTHHFNCRLLGDANFKTTKNTNIY